MIYKTIEKLRPYFHSIREVEGNVSLDVKFPTKWKIDYEEEGLKIIPQDKNEKITLISYVMPATEEGYESVIGIILGIVKFNLEQEEKEKLFQDKIRELKGLFAEESLDKLKEINFLGNGTKTELSTEPGDGMVDQGN